MVNYHEVEILYYTYKRLMPNIDDHTLKNKIIDMLIFKYSYRNYSDIISIVNMKSITFVIF